MPADSTQPAAASQAEGSPGSRGNGSAFARSRLSNGADLFLAEVDGRSREARRYRDVYSDLVQHLGGADHASEARKHLAKRATALIVWCEVIEAKLAAGQELEVGPYTTAINSLRRLLSDLGLDPTARDLTPSLGEYLAARSA